MSVSPVTNDFMKALPAALRPNPYNIDEYVMQAVEKGWQTDALAKACYINEKNPNAGFVVFNLKTLCLHGPKQETVRNAWNYGHIPCKDPWHAVGCQICRCLPGEVTHHIPVACPPELRGLLKMVGRPVE
jgi:hypothetical protein